MLLVAVGGGGGEFKCIYICYIFAPDFVVLNSKCAPKVVSKPSIMLLDDYLMLFPQCVCFGGGGGGRLCPFLSICWAILSLNERDFCIFGKFCEGIIFAMVLFSLNFADAENKTLAK